MLLIVEDDPHYARVLLGLARDKGFKCIVTSRGAGALTLARSPADGDYPGCLLPDMLGWTVLTI